MTTRRLLLAAIALAAAMQGARAESPRIENVISFSTSANLEVTKDLLTVTLQVVRDGTDAASVQAGMKQALDAALAEAKKSAAPGQMDVRTGNFSLNPRYGRDGKINGWQGQAELVLEGKDLPRVAQAAGRINGRYAEFDWQPIRYLNKSFARGQLAGFLRIGRVGLITPLRDGMNLVAKEYVAAQNPENPGLLVLSRFAGAARELDTALIVNPYDIE